MKITLKSDYITVHYPSKTRKPTYGSNQKLHPDAGIQKDGCGACAAMDVLSYLEGKTSYTSDAFEERASNMVRTYFPYRPNHGTSGFVIRNGLNRYFKEHGLSYKAHWGVSRKKLYASIEKMLGANVPVILTVGPKYPGIASPYKLNLFQKDEEGKLQSFQKTNGHYMVVTGMSDNWLRVSSWGDEYYINRREYMEYAVKHSFYFFTNIILIQ